MIICKKLHFDAAHRILNHESKCKMLHGHRYVLEVQIKGQGLDDLGRVIDFGQVTNILGKWVEENLDHNTILFNQDRQLGEQISKATGQEIYYLNSNPTAENIALHIKNDIFPKLFAGHDLQCHQIKLFETPNCYTIC